nr:MAG TPA: PROTEIN/RNA Complex, archaeal, ribosomal, 50S, protein.0A [Caudoviricetes sp.]
MPDTYYNPFTAPKSDTLHCPCCGAQIPQDSTFCQWCGVEIPTVKFLDGNIKPYKLFRFEITVPRRQLLYVDAIEQFYKQIAIHLAEKLIEEKMITFYSNYDESTNSQKHYGYVEVIIPQNRKEDVGNE